MFNATEKMTGTLPTISVRGVIPLPNNEIRLDIGRNESLKALKLSEQYQNYVVLLVQNNPMIEEVTSKDINEIGVVAKITLNMTIPNNIRRVKFQTIVRCRVTSYEETKPVLLANFETVFAAYIVLLLQAIFYFFALRQISFYLSLSRHFLSF